MKKIMCFVLTVLLLSGCANAVKAPTTAQSTSSAAIEPSLESESVSEIETLEGLEFLDDLDLLDDLDDGMHDAIVEPPATFDQFPFTIEVSEKDVLGNTYLESTVTNNSNLILTEFFYESVIPSTGNKVPNFLAQVVLPGETSTIFRNSGEAGMTEADVVGVTYTIEDEENSYYVKYDVKTQTYMTNVNPVKGSTSTALEDLAVTLDELEILVAIDDLDILGKTYAYMRVTNNSNYAISQIGLEAKQPISNEIAVFYISDPIEPGATLQGDSNPVEEIVSPADFLALSFTASIDEQNYIITYDFQLDRYRVTKSWF